MKKIMAVIAVIVIVLSFFGCAIKPANGDQNDTKTPVSGTDAPKSQDAVYSSLIDLLQAELSRLRSEQNADESVYQAKLHELEAEIDKLRKTTSGNVSSTESPKDTAEPIPFTYTVSGNEATITGYTGNFAVLVIPEKLAGNTVTCIADSAFKDAVVLTSVTVPSGVKKIGWFAFSGCTSLKSITLPATVAEIGYDAFAYCKKLTVYCPSGSYAERFAKSYGIQYVSN